MTANHYCIITPDTTGPIKNGGIGTHCYYLAELLGRQPDSETTLLFTGPIDSESLEYWEQYYREKLNVQFVHADTLPWMFDGVQYGNRGTLAGSQRVYQWLKKRNFNVFFFQDWRADAFVPIQAKRAGIAFKDTLISVTFHSPTEWQRQGMAQYPRSEEEMLTEYMERYCMQHADLIISPSQHMFDWAEANKWKIVADHRVVPYLFVKPEAAITPRPFDGRSLIFFGRLETRKGFEVFLSALQKLAPDFREQETKIDVHCLGKIAPTYVGDSNDAIKHFLGDATDVYTVKVQSDLSQPEALAFLGQHSQALIVAPSLLDNLPFSIIECVELNLNILAGATGGIPELFENPDRLFDPVPAALTEKLRDIFKNGLPPLRKRYSSENSERLWRNLLEDVSHSSPVVSTNASPGSAPLVSVCVPHFNYGRYLPGLLDSLTKQTYQNFAVIVIDDGSTDPASVEVFDSMQQKYETSGWRFIKKQNEGVGIARNFAASMAESEYLVFMDADNLAMPNMLTAFVTAMQSSHADCLTCYFQAFETEDALKENHFRYSYAPVGGCLEGGINDNIFGDTNFIIRKDVYQAEGGMRELRGIAHEDWEFLARILLNGRELDTIPECLFYYRYEEDSRSRATSEYRNHANALNAYFDTLPEWAGRYILNAIGSRITQRNSIDPLIRSKDEALAKRRADIAKLKADKLRLKEKLQEAKEEMERRRLRNRLLRIFGNPKSTQAPRS